MQQVHKTKRLVNQLLHNGVGDFAANNDHALTQHHTVMLEIPETPCSVYEWIDIFQPKDNGEFGTSTQYGGPCKQFDINHRGAERGTTPEENVNQKILEVTRNQTAKLSQSKMRQRITEMRTRPTS